MGRRIDNQVDALRAVASIDASQESDGSSGKWYSPSQPEGAPLSPYSTVDHVLATSSGLSPVELDVTEFSSPQDEQEQSVLS